MKLLLQIPSMLTFLQLTRSFAAKLFFCTEFHFCDVHGVQTEGEFAQVLMDN